MRQMLPHHFLLRPWQSIQCLFDFNDHAHAHTMHNPLFERQSGSCLHKRAAKVGEISQSRLFTARTARARLQISPTLRISRSMVQRLHR